MTVATVPQSWEELAQSLQAELSSMDAAVRAAVPSVQVRPGSNGASAWALFCYRVYALPPGADVDPVVVGINISHPDATGVISVSGDIAGETLGDMLVDVPPRRASDRRAAEDAARQLGAGLSRHAGAVIRALKDQTRRA